MPGRRSVAAAHEWAAAFLQKRGVTAARREAWRLLCHAGGLALAEALAHPERELDERAWARFRRLVYRRGRRIPLQYLLGEAEFYGRPFRVDRRVLIPRPETELIVDWCREFFQGVGAPLALADLGTGSGVLAVTLALELPQAEVHAVDISPGALAVARSNARRHGVEGRVRFHRGDFWEPLARAGLRGRLDGAVSNPPYVAAADLADLMPEVRDHEPRVALLGGPEGLDCLERIIREAPAFLKPGAPLILEVGAGQAERVAGMLRATGAFRDVRVRRDLGGHERVVAGMRV